MPGGWRGVQVKNAGTDFDTLLSTLAAHPEGISIQEVAEMMGIHRNTAAKYLEVLLSRGEVDVRRVGVSKLFIPGRRIPFSCVRRLYEEPVIGIDRDLEVVDLNESAETFFGRSRSELIGTSAWKGDRLLGQESVESLREVLKGSWLTWELPLYNPALLVRGIPVKYSDNRTGAAIVMVDQNQSEGLRAELTHTSDLLSLITTYQTEYIIRLNPDLTYTWVNPAYASLFHTSPQQMAGTRLSLRVPEEERDRFLNTIRSSSPQGTEIDYRVLLPSGDIRYHHAIFRPLDDPASSPGGYLGVCRDVTEFKLKEEQFQRFYEGTEGLLADRTRELRELNSQMYREIAEREQVETILRSVEFTVQHVADMILWFDVSGSITYSNHSAREMLIRGIECDPVPISRIIRHSPSGSWDTFWETLRKQKTLFHESILTLPDEQTIPAEILFNHMDYGNQEYCCCVARDIHERKLAMAELIESENRFRQLASVIPEIFYLYDLRTNSLLYINPAFEKIFGISLDTIYRDPGCWRKNLHPEDLVEIIRIISDIHSPFRSVEGRIIRTNGETRWVDARLFSIMDDEGHPIREVGVIADITERKKIEEELRITSDRFLTTIKATPVSICNQDTDLRYTWIGQSSLGLAPHEVLGRTDHDIFPLEIANRLASVKRKALHSGKSIKADLEIDVGGRLRSMRLFVEPFRDINGSVSGITVAGIDLTDLFRTREALRISEEKFRRFFDETSDICIVFKTIPDESGAPVDFRFEDLNHQALSRIEVSKKDIIGRPLSAFPPDIDPRWFSALMTTASTGEPVTFECYSALYCRHLSVHVYLVGEGHIGVIAHDISIFIRSYEQVEHQRDLAISLASTTDISKALNLILDTGMRVPGIDSGGIYFAVDEETLSLQAHAGLSQDFVRQVSSIQFTPHVREQFHEGVPLYYTILKPLPSPTPPQILMDEGLTTYVSIPILTHGSLFAVLNLGSHVLSEIPANERPYLEGLASYLGEVLARLRYCSLHLEDTPPETGDTVWPVIQIYNSDGSLIEGSPVYTEDTRAHHLVWDMVTGSKELLYTGQEVTGIVSLPGCLNQQARVRIRFVPWGREIAYLVIWSRQSDDTGVHGEGR